MRERRRFGLGACAVAILATLAPATANAAYAPRFEVALDPTTAEAAPSITGSVTQANGEDATKVLTLTAPAGFNPNLRSTLGSCSAANEASWTCPEDSRMGEASATAGGVALSGPVHVSTEGGTIRVLVFLQGLGGLLKVKLVGDVVFRQGGGFDTVFDDLPSTQTEYVQLRLEGGGRSLIQNPGRCGTYSFQARMESQQGAVVEASVPIAIGGCRSGGGAGGDGDDEGNGGGGGDDRRGSGDSGADRGDPGGPVISRAGLRPRRLRAGGKAVLSWILSERTARTRIVVERQSGSRWKRAGTLNGPGAQGRNTLRFAGKLGRRALRPGRYRFALQAANAAGLNSAVELVPFTLLARR